MSMYVRQYSVKIHADDEKDFDEMLRSQGWKSPGEYLKFKIEQDLAIYKHKCNYMLPLNNFTRRPAEMYDHALNHMDKYGDVDPAAVAKRMEAEELKKKS